MYRCALYPHGRERGGRKMLRGDSNPSSETLMEAMAYRQAKREG